MRLTEYLKKKRKKKRKKERKWNNIGAKRKKREETEFKTGGMTWVKTRA